MPKPFYLILLFILFPELINAQDSRIVPVSHWSVSTIQQLQQRGYLHELHPTRLPWTYQQVQNALNESEVSNDELAEYWLNELKSYFIQHNSDFGIDANGLIRRYNSDREELLRPVGSGEILTPALRLGTWVRYNNWVARTGITTDIAYWQDPDGVDVTHRLLGRTEDYYVGYSDGRVSGYFGRFDRHWGLPGRSAAVLSDNPRSYDAISFHFGNERFELSSIWGQLDNLAADGSFFSRDSFEPGARKRFVSMHRFDWSPRPNLRFSFVEGVVYAGEQAGLELEFMNPVPIWTISQDSDPKNVYANLVFGFSGWWNINNWTIYSEFMLDDIVVNDRAEAKARRDFKPAALAWITYISRSAILGEFDLTYGYQFVSSTAYRSELFMGQWTYAQRGLGLNFSDYVQYDLEITWHAHRFLPGLSISPYVEYLLQGEGDVRLPQSVTMPNGRNIPLILSGTVSRNTRVAFRAHYRYSSHLWASLDWGLNDMINRYHREDFNERLLVGRITIGGNFNYRN